MTNKTAAEKIIEKFGTASRLAKAIGRSRSCISHWKERGGNIPSNLHGDILGAAKDMGIKISKDELVNA